MSIEAIIIYAFITIFSLGLLVVSFTSYRRSSNLKLVFVTLVFLVFLIKGLLLSIGLFSEELADVTASVYMGLFDLIILILLFIATIRR